MPSTSSPYVVDITLKRNGRHPIDHSFVNTLLGSHWAGRTSMSNAYYRWWVIRAHVRHLVGALANRRLFARLARVEAHTWVPIENWAFIEEQLQVEVVGYNCWICNTRRD